MATDGTPPGSAPNQVPSEQPAAPRHTESPATATVSSRASKPTNTISTATAHPLQVHVPSVGPPGLPHATRTLPGGLLPAQFAAPPHLPAAAAAAAAQAGLMPFPYGHQLLAAGGPRGGGPLPPGLTPAAAAAGLPGLGGQPMLVAGGGIMRHPRRTMQPVVHPYQRVSHIPAAPAAPVQPYQMLTAARTPAVSPPAAALQTPYGHVFIPVSNAGYTQLRMAQPAAAVPMDPATAALYAQYSQAAAFSPYLTQMQHPGTTPVSSYGQQLYDPQKLLSAHYAQVLVPDQNNTSPATATAINGTSAAVVETQETS